MAIIEALNVHKQYYVGQTPVEALSGVDMVVEAGEMVAVMGPSGCGKTTLLNCLSGLDRFDQGTVRIGGRMLETLNDRQRTRHRATHMGFVFQAFNLLPVISAVENVEFPLLITGMSPGAARTRAREMLAQVGLEDRLSHLPAQLSGGQRQRVAIARALANRPAIVWADEPTGNLDEDTSRDMLELLRYLNHTQGQTFVVVTHDPQVSRRCHRTVHMQGGRIQSVDWFPGSRTATPAAYGRV